jgi:hypothetical protein
MLLLAYFKAFLTPEPINSFEVEMLGLNSDKFADPAAEFVNHLKYHCFFKFCRISI